MDPYDKEVKKVISLKTDSIYTLGLLFFNFLDPGSHHEKIIYLKKLILYWKSEGTKILVLNIITSIAKLFHGLPNLNASLHGCQVYQIHFLISPECYREIKNMDF